MAQIQVFLKRGSYMDKNDKRYRFLNNPRIARQVIDELDGDEQAQPLKYRILTEEEYNALEQKDENCLYLFKSEDG